MGVEREIADAEQNQSTAHDFEMNLISPSILKSSFSSQHMFDIRENAKILMCKFSAIKN